MKCFLCNKTHKIESTFSNCVEKHDKKGMVDWHWIIKYQILSESFIERFQDKVNWSLISQCQILSESFIERFQDKVNWYEISQYQILSESFIERFKHKLDIQIIKDKKKNHISISEYAKKHNLKIDDKYLYAYRNHDKRGAGTYKSNSKYEKGIYYRDWHCDTNPNNENSYGFGIWPEGNTKVRIKLEDWGTAVHKNSGRKGRVWGFEII